MVLSAAADVSINIQDNDAIRVCIIWLSYHYEQVVAKCAAYLMTILSFHKYIYKQVRKKV
jgi:hypothetical protein